MHGNGTSLTILAKIATHVILPIAMFFLILSVYCGWKANGVLAGQLLARKTFDVIVDPITLMKIGKYGYFQFYLFIVAIASVGLCFILKVLTFFSKEEVKKVLCLTIFVLVVPGLILGFCLYSKCQEYNRAIDQKIIEAKKEKSPSAQLKISPRKEARLSDTLLKELIDTSRDITKLLLNWAILLLTGLGYLMVRTSKLID